VDHRRARWLPE